MADPDVIASVDVGASRIICAVGRIREGNIISISGVGISLPAGLENGAVSDPEMLSGSIEKAISEASEMSGIEIDSVFIHIAQTNFQSVISRGVHSPARANKPLTRFDVNRTIGVAQLLSKKSGKEIVQEIIQDFIVDGQDSISNPVGMHASKLEVDVYFLTGAVSNFSRTIKEAARRAGVEVERVFTKPIAAAEPVLTQLEKKIGVLLVDLGCSSTSIAAYSNGKITGTKVLAAGLNRITDDIAAEFHLPTRTAEKIKRERAKALVSSLARENRKIHLAADNGETFQIPEKRVCEIAEKNLHEIFNLVKQEMDKFKFPRRRNETIVLTGGGALLKDIDKYVEGKFNLPVRLGRPEGRVEGWGKLLNNPSYSTVIGLLIFGLKDRQIASMRNIGWQNPLIKIQNWIKAFFSWI